jgi:hypothetical protein
MSQMGQERRIGAVRNISALPPRADVRADIVKPPVSANCGHAAPLTFARDVPIAASYALYESSWGGTSRPGPPPTRTGCY